jgi:hypothetical protein
VKIFLGYGYNDRDRWIESFVAPILRCMDFDILDGKDMHGDTLQDGVKTRIDQADLLVGFLTLRVGQESAEFNSHIWVRDELAYAVGRGKPVYIVLEEEVKYPQGILGNRQYIPLKMDAQLECVTELVTALGRRSMLRLKLEPDDDDLRRNLFRWRREAGFMLRYRVQDGNGVESGHFNARMELINQAFYLTASNVYKDGMIEVEGLLDGQVRFDSGWISADAITVKIK